MATGPLFRRGQEPGKGLGRQRKEGRERKRGRKVTSGFLCWRSTASQSSCAELAPKRSQAGSPGPTPSQAQPSGDGAMVIAQTHKPRAARAGSWHASDVAWLYQRDGGVGCGAMQPLVPCLEDLNLAVCGVDGQR